MKQAKRVLQLTAVIKREDDYVDTCPKLEIVGEGQTIEDARLNFLEAVENFLKLLQPRKFTAIQSTVPQVDD